MLGAKYNVYQHGPSGEEVVRTLSYSLPQELHSHIDVVAPTTYFGTLRSMRSTSFIQPRPGNDAGASLVPISDATVPASCRTTITPTCLRDLYNTSTYVPAATNVNKLGVAGYLGEFANTADLQVAPSSRNNVWILMCPSYLIRHSSRNSVQTLSALHLLLCLSTEEVMIRPILVWR